MLCGLREDGGVQCDVYWPDEKLSSTEIEIGGRYTIKLTKTEKPNKFYLMRYLELKDKSSGEFKNIKQYHVSPLNKSLDCSLA